MEIQFHNVWNDIQAIQKNNPLIHNITNYVVMEQTANALLALGASPVMTHAVEEARDMTRIAQGLVLNMGTVNPLQLQMMIEALKAAKDVPVVFDPVGCGATPYRIEVADRILELGNITAIRGNASEIAALTKSYASTKGVDSSLDSADCIEQAKALALQNECTVWMSGKTDVITNGHGTHFIHHGHPLMAKVTGMGCTASALTAAFLAVNPDPLLACAHTAVLMGVAGERAALIAAGPGAFKAAFLDVLYTIDILHPSEKITGY